MPRKEPFPRIVGNWSLLEALGSGYSGKSNTTVIVSANTRPGSIFRAQNIHTGQIMALKIQDVDHECPTNNYEKHIYPLLQGGKGMPTLWASGVHSKWNYLVIDLLGSSLDKLYKASGKEKMDLRSVCCIAMQLVCPCPLTSTINITEPLKSRYNG
jgi:casein kinase 1